jgi:hypothetical protein
MTMARNLVKRYGSTMAVSGLFFSIRPSLVTGFLGPNDAGPMEWCRPIPADEAEPRAARCPELTLHAEPALHEAFVKIGDGQIDGADWQAVSRLLEACSEQQPDLLPTDLGLPISYLPSELGPDTYQDFAVAFNGRPRR